MMVFDYILDGGYARFRFECDYCHNIIAEDGSDGVTRVACKPGSRVQHFHQYCLQNVPIETVVPYAYGDISPINMKCDPELDPNALRTPLDGVQSFQIDVS